MIETDIIYFNPQYNSFRTTEIWDIFTFFTSNFKNKVEFFKFMDTYLDYLKTGSTFIFDNSHEFLNFQLKLNDLGNQLNPFELILNYINNHNLKNNSIQVWTGNLHIKSNIDNSYKNIVFPKIRFADFPRYCDDINLLTNRTFNKKFICVMGKVRENRDNLFNFLNESNILTNSYYSYNTVWVDTTLPTHYLEDDTFIKSTPIWELSSHFMKGGYEYQSKSFVNIVSETFFFNNSKFGDPNGEGVLYFSEKIFKSITMAQPFILLAKSNSLKKLKELGFKTFSDFWDESYDTEENDDIRFKKICNLINHINNFSLSECKDIYEKMIPILKHNYYQSFEIRKNKDYFLPKSNYMFNDMHVSFEERVKLKQPLLLTQLP